MAGLSMARFFQLLGAPLRNSRWSWGAAHPDGTIFLRQWESDIVRDPDGREYVRIAHRESPAGPRQHGWRERLTHIEAIRNGAPCRIVMVAAHDPLARQKSVRSFDARFVAVGGSLITRDGAVYVELLDRKASAEVLPQAAVDVSGERGTVSFRPREFKGSRLRCLLATSLPRQQVADFLTSLVAPYAAVTTEDVWRPAGLLDPGEAKLGEAADFLSAEARETLTGWWLRVTERANTPNWDLVCTCRMTDGQRGLVLVEAKAHAAELHGGGKPAGNAMNDAHIRAAIAEAQAGLGRAGDGWGLSADRNYQLSNRFAWAWKISSLGIPVVLVYLGFLDANEMSGGPFATPDEWRACVLEHAAGTVPQTAWDAPLATDGAAIVPLIRSARLEARVVHSQPLALRT